MNCGETDTDATGIAFADPDSIPTWEKEIEQAHPIIKHYPKQQWPRIAKFNGWLPLPPA